MLPVYSHPEVPASPHLLDFRSNLPAVDEFLCINILTVTNQSFWFLLARGHHRTTPARFISLPRIPFPTVDSACATIGNTIYVLGGSWNGYPTDTVQIFNSLEETWKEGQRMEVPRQFSSAGMIGGQMYAVGGSPSLEWWAEAFDPIFCQWSPIHRTSGIPRRPIAQNLFLDGRFLETDNGELLYVGYDPLPRDRDFWSLVKTTMGKMAMLDGVIYTCRLGGFITGLEPATNYSFVLPGLDLSRELSPNLWESSKMIKYRGMLCVVWKDNQMINCIGIQVHRARNEMVSGSVAWRERVLLPTDSVNGELEYCGTLEFRSP